MARISRSAVVVGRDPELAEVRRLVDAVGRREGGVLLVTGEAGIGKSRLLAEAARRARDVGLAVLTGRAVEGGGSYRAVAGALVGHGCADELADAEELRPYRAALGRILPGWARGEDEPEPSVDPVLVLGEGLVRLLRAIGGERGTLLVLEDLHWADADTLALVEYLAGSVRDSPVLVAASARDDRAGAAFAGRLGGAAGATTLPLSRLGPKDVVALASACAGGAVVPDAQRRFLVERSEGLPFLVEELLAGLPEAGPPDGTAAGPPPAVPVPPTLAGLVARRMAALTADQRLLVEAAAVLGAGADLDWTVLGPATGLAEPAVLAALRAAVDADLLASEDGRLRWRHALTRDAVRATLLPPERAALARAAAEVLARRGGPDDDAAAAELLASAGEEARAAGILVGLARRDLARGALRSAEELLRRAAETGALRPAVVAGRVHLLTLVGRAPAALGVGAEVLDSVTGDEHAELCLRLARAAIAAGRWAQAERYVERAGRPDDPRSFVLAADAAFGAGDPDRAAVLAATAAERAERAERPEARCEALVVVGRCAWRRDLAAAEAAFRRAAQVAAEHGLAPWRVEALRGLGTVEAFGSDLAPSLLEARELALDSGMLAQVASVDVMLADCTLVTDGPRAAEPVARGAAEQAGKLRLANLQVWAELTLAGVRAAAGDVAAMDAALDAAAALPHAPREAAALASVVRALPPLLAQDLERANALVDRGVAVLARHGSAAPLHYWGLWALLRTAVGDRDAEARDLLRAAPAALRAANRAGLRYADAVAAGRAGRGDEAAALLAAADDVLAGQQWWRRLLRLVALGAAVADGWGDPVPALRADLAAHERAGDSRLARACRDLLRRAGAPTRRGRGATPVPPGLRALGVTSREMDVLGLVADGLTNAQVAERLFVSPRTVETHVANLLAKAGATTRAELRSFAAPQNP